MAEICRCGHERVSHDHDMVTGHVGKCLGAVNDLPCGCRVWTPASDRKVGCERDDGLLNFHPESETCEVCAPYVAPCSPVSRADIMNAIYAVGRAHAEVTRCVLKDADHETREAAIAAFTQAYATLNALLDKREGQLRGWGWERTR